MSLNYSVEICKNCNKKVRVRASITQKIILGALLSVLIIPGIVYYFKAIGDDCQCCGLHRQHRQK